MSIMQSLAYGLISSWQKVKQQNARVMKTTKTILSLALIVLSSSLFARIAEPEANCNCCPTDVEVVLEQDMSLETWMSVPFEESVLEAEINLVNWMVTPFEASLDADLVLETWMADPFESSLDGELPLETWMSVPFKSTLDNEQLQLESWMADAWI